jgi:hypothetical protein
MSTVFQTFFTSFLVDPGYQKQLTTLEELLDSGIKFGFHHDINAVYMESSDWRHKEILARKEECSLPQTCLDRIRERGDFAILIQDWLVQDYTNEINDHNFVCPLNDVDSFFVFISLYVQKGSFLLEVVNKLVTVAFESGMVMKADRDNIATKRDVVQSANVFGKYFVFTLNHLRIAFYILLVGHSMGLAFFVCELVFRSRQRAAGVL